MENKELIDYRLYDPSKAIFGNRKDKSKFTTLYCSNKHNCNLYSKGQCVMWSGLWGNRCEFGLKKVEEGYTSRASKFNYWLGERRKKVEGIKQLDSAPDKVAKVGDKIYFPYPHWYMISDLPKILQGSAFNSLYWIPENMFNVELLKIILQGTPFALMGGAIMSYKDKIVPKIVEHLKEEMPDLYSELENKYPEITSKFKNVNYIGRKAYVDTIVKNVIFNIERKGDCFWNGQQLIFEDYNMSFSPVKGKTEVRITPNENETIEITSNDMVDLNTKFKD